MQDARVRIALVLLGILALGGSGIALYSSRHDATPPIVITPPPSDPGPTPSPAPVTTAPGVPKAASTRVSVDVSGAVRRPWLYTLPSGSRILQAVLAAGGPTPKADLDAVNLAEPVKDGEKVYIPTRQAQAAAAGPSSPPGNVIGYAPSRPHFQSPVLSRPALPTILEPGQAGAALASSSGKHYAGGRGDKITSPDQGQVCLNTADATQLQRLPGVGPAMAARILAFRDQAHGFQSLSELQEIGGIGPKKFAKIAPLVTLN